MPGKKNPDARETPVYLDRNLQIIFAVTLMAVLGVSSITPVFPEVMDQFGISGAQVGLLITFYTLPGVFLSPVMGVLADRLGRKKILLPSLLIFAVAGTACAFARNFGLLLALRGLQGVGGASLGSMNTTIVGDLFSGRRRAEAMGMNASVLSIGTGLYPAIGGSLAILGWYYPFALPVVALPVGALVLFYLKSPEPGSRQNLKEYLVSTWRNLRNIRVVGLFLAGIATFIILYGAYLTYFSLLLDQSFGASSFVIGILLSVMSLSTAAVSSQLGRINRWLSLGNIIKVAFVIYGVAMFLVPFMPSELMLLIPLIIFGIAHGSNVPSIQTSVAGLAPLEYRAAFMSLNATMLRIGQTIGPPLMAVLYVYRGSSAVFFGASALAILVALVAVISGRIFKTGGARSRA